jgi:hypothetical protein
LENLRLAFRKIPADACPPRDVGGTDNLTRNEQMNFLLNKGLPPSIRLYSLVSFASSSRSSAPLLPFNNLLNRIDPRNDGQMIYDPVLPNSTLLGYVNADHWAIALPFNRLATPWKKVVSHSSFPREILIESVLIFIDEDNVSTNSLNR